MKKSFNPVLQSPRGWPVHGKLRLAAAMILMLASVAHASAAPAQFDVLIELTAAGNRPQTGSCTPAAGVTTTIVCDTRLTTAASPIASAAAFSSRLGTGYRFVSYASGLSGSLDIYTGAGTSTAFRLVNWADREYIEMTVGW